MKLLSTLLVGMMACTASAMNHKMQHGFVLSRNDTIANHLVAEGHHSYQVVALGHLEFTSDIAREFYKQLKSQGGNKYYLFQAQNIDISKLPQKLYGHIIQMEIGKYEPGGAMVPDAIFTIDEVLSSFPNPFFEFPNKSSLKTMSGDDSCYKRCARSCMEKPLFCGQW